MGASGSRERPGSCPPESLGRRAALLTPSLQPDGTLVRPQASRTVRQETRTVSSHSVVICYSRNRKLIRRPTASRGSGCGQPSWFLQGEWLLVTLTGRVLPGCLLHRGAFCTHLRDQMGSAVATAGPREGLRWRGSPIPQSSHARGRPWSCTSWICHLCVSVNLSPDLM